MGTEVQIAPSPRSWWPFGILVGSAVLLSLPLGFLVLALEAGCCSGPRHSGIGELVFPFGMMFIHRSNPPAAAAAALLGLPLYGAVLGVGYKFGRSFLALAATAVIAIHVAGYAACLARGG